MGIVILTPGEVSFLNANSAKDDKVAFSSFIQGLMQSSIYFYFGNRAMKLIRNVWREFTPSKVVDHIQLAETQNIGADMNAVSQSLFQENFCVRTLASPRETGLTQLMKNHLIMKLRLLQQFASPFLGTDTWEMAREKTSGIFYSKSRPKFFRGKAKNAK